MTWKCLQNIGITQTELPGKNDPKKDVVNFLVHGHSHWFREVSLEPNTHTGVWLTINDI